MLEPKKGVLTFRAEGNNIPGSAYFEADTLARFAFFML